MHFLNRYNYWYYRTLCGFLDIGNDGLREYFKKKWPIVHQRLKGTPPPSEWSDTPDDAALLNEIGKLKFYHPDAGKLFKSGNTKNWDFSILQIILRNSTLEFIENGSPEDDALKTLSRYRNIYAHSPNSKAISRSAFDEIWMQLRPALGVFGATQEHFIATENLW